MKRVARRKLDETQNNGCLTDTSVYLSSALSRAGTRRKTTSKRAHKPKMNLRVGKKINQSMKTTRLENPAKKLERGKSNASHWKGETENQSNMGESS